MGQPRSSSRATICTNQTTGNNRANHGPYSCKKPTVYPHSINSKFGLLTSSSAASAHVSASLVRQLPGTLWRPRGGVAAVQQAAGSTGSRQQALQAAGSTGSRQQALQAAGATGSRPYR